MGVGRFPSDIGSDVASYGVQRSCAKSRHRRRRLDSRVDEGAVEVSRHAKIRRGVLR